MKIDSLQQSVKGPAAAGFVPRIIRICIIHLFVLGTNWLPTAICKGACCCWFCPRVKWKLYSTTICFGDKLVACSNLQRGLLLLLLSQD